MRRRGRLTTVHPHVFKHQLTTYHGYFDAAIKAGAVMAPLSGSFASFLAARGSGEAASRTPSWTRWAGVGTAAVAAIGTAAATAIASRSDPVNDTYRWITEHVVFVKNLWDERQLTTRMSACDVPFHSFYTRVAPARTFVLLPDASAPYASHFSPLDSRAPDEISAHTTMFSGAWNTSYFAMGLASASLVSEWLPRSGVPDTPRTGIPTATPGAL